MATASMDFFEHQDRARRMTGRLVLLFAAAVAGIVASTYALVLAILYGMGHYARSRPDSPFAGELDPHAFSYWQPEVFLLVLIATLVVVGFGSLYKVSQLSGGGHVVAEHLGGRRLSPDSRDPLERKVLNVVEEMAIASGTPVPPVFLLDGERGINAFAAGLRPEDAVIGVTRGCVERLTRDQLQGVIAHEFSHILNGDMRLNIRLIGVIHGILVIGLIGYYLMRSTIYMRSSSSKKGDPRAVLLAMGVGLMVIGFLGTLFGNLIKAAVSRQREFLADASAVQFTRNPDGIAGALKAIGGYEGGSAIVNPNAPEASHMFFAMGLASGLESMFATHPPLPERIRRIDRTWEHVQAERRATGGVAAGASGAAAAGATGFAGETAAAPRPRLGRSEPAGSAETSASDAVESIGRPTPRHVAYAHDVIESIPADLTDAAREPYGARAVVYALLLDPDADTRKRQLDRLAVRTDSGVYHATAKLFPLVRDLPRKARLPLIDLAIPALRSLSSTHHARFRDNVAELVNADQRIDLFEWVLHKIVLRHVDAHFAKQRGPRSKHGSLDPVADAVATVLSALSYVGAKDAAASAAAFAAGAKAANLSLTQKPMEACRLGALDKALDALNELTPSARRTMLNAAAATIAADRRITTSEAELLRAVADTLDSPMPPLV